MQHDLCLAQRMVERVELARLLRVLEVEPAVDNGANLVDLFLQRERRSHASAPFMLKQEFRNRPAAIFGADQIGGRHEIGRASCREKVCQYVEISVVAVPLKKKTNK